MDALTSQSVDAEYSKLCSQIGELFCRRSDVASQLAAIDAQLLTHQSRRTQLVAQYQALQHNENAAASDKNGQ